MTEAGLIAARFAHYVALVLAFGAFAYAGFGDRSAAVGGRLHRLGLGSAVALLAAALAVLAATVAGLGGGFGTLSDPTLWSAVLIDTDFGRVWAVRLLLATALIGVGVGVWRGPSRRLKGAGLLLAGGLVVTVALTGHAQAEEGPAGLVHQLADAAHLVAAAVWLGALAPLLLLVAEGRRSSRPDAELAAARLDAFHAIGMVSVATLVVTGLANGYFLVGGAEALLTTFYGRVLLAKLVLFVLMLGLAADNRFRLAPLLRRDLARRVDAPSALTRLRAHVAGELVLGALVLATVAVLGAISPASAA